MRGSKSKTHFISIALHPLQTMIDASGMIERHSSLCGCTHYLFRRSGKTEIVAARKTLTAMYCYTAEACPALQSAPLLEAESQSPFMVKGYHGADRAVCASKQTMHVPEAVGLSSSSQYMICTACNITCSSDRPLLTSMKRELGIMHVTS